MMDSVATSIPLRLRLKHHSDANPDVPSALPKAQPTSTPTWRGGGLPDEPSGEKIQFWVPTNVFVKPVVGDNADDAAHKHAHLAWWGTL